TKETYKNLWDTITHGKSWAGEFLNRKKNGDQYWEKATITPVKNNNNEIVNYIAVKEDITEKRRALNELKESEEKFFKAYHNNPDSLHITSIPDGRFIEVNSVFERLSGYSKEELIGKTSTEMGFYVNLNDRERLFNQLSDKGKLVDYEIIFRMKSGKQRICRLFSEIIEIKGKPQLLTIVRDITKQKQIEDQLNKLTTAVEQSANTVVITDLEGNIEYVNKKFTEITGYTYEEAIGQNPRILKTDYHKNKIYQKLWNTITNGKTWRGEFLNKKKNGDLYWESASITPVKNDQGDIINYIAIKEDITELKRNQEELIQAGEIWQNIQNGLYIYHLEDIEDDTTLRMIAANPASEILTGIRTRDVIGKTLDENFPGLREKGIPQKYAEVVRTKNNIRFEDLVYGDDRVIQGAFSVEAFSLPENKVGVSFENISERKQAEGKLRKSEQKLSIHIEETPVGVIEWNIDFEVTSWNKAAENIFGYSKEEAIGSHTVGLIVPESAREKIDVVWDALINQTGG
ncbi:MAG: PAS domain S-box protein, partial [Cyclobacteriaceae bacterium]|nr:PAS domain S-box protein [Cyclobacteriaceae bacterium]